MEKRKGIGMGKNYAVEEIAFLQLVDFLEAKGISPALDESAERLLCELRLYVRKCKKTKNANRLLTRMG